MTTINELKQLLDQVQRNPQGRLKASNRLLWKQAKATVEACGNQIPDGLADVLSQIASHFHRCSEPSFIFDIFAAGDVDKLFAPLRARLEQFFDANKKLHKYFSQERIKTRFFTDISALQKVKNDLFAILIDSGARDFIQQKMHESLIEALFAMMRLYTPLESVGDKRVQLAEGEIPLCAISDLKHIADGGFAEVYKGFYQGKPVAVKILKSPAGASAPSAASASSALAVRAANSETSSVSDKEFAAELASLQKLRSPHVVNVFGHRTYGALKIIVMELMKSSLGSLLLSDIELPWPSRLQMALEVAQGLQFLHEHRVIHCDLKAGNVLVDLQGHCKISDFGLAVNKELTSLSFLAFRHAMGVRPTATLAYMAPELFDSQSAFSWKSDVYAFAMILWEIAARKIPYATVPKDKSDVLVYSVKVNQEREDIPEGAPAGYTELMEECWQQNKDVRPKLVEIIERLKAITP